MVYVVVTYTFPAGTVKTIAQQESSLQGNTFI